MASQPTAPSPEDFPPLNKDPQEKSFLEKPFKRFLTIRHQNADQKMTDLNPFEVERKLKSVLGKKSSYKVSKLRSGLLIEVGQANLCDRLLKTKKLVDIPVVCEEHSGLNTSMGSSLL